MGRSRVYRRVLLEDLPRWTAIGWRPAVTFRDELGEVIGAVPICDGMLAEVLIVRDDDETSGATTPACWGCECGVPVRNGQHEEPADVVDDCGLLVDTGMVYTYPCTRPPVATSRIRLPPADHVLVDVRAAAAVRAADGARERDAGPVHGDGGTEMKIRDTKPRMRRDGETDRSWEAHCKRREAAMAKRPGRSWRVLVQSSTDHWDAHSEDHPGLVFDELVVDHWIHLEQMSTRIWYLGIGDHQLSIYVPRDGSPPKLVHYELGDLAKIIKAKGVPR